MNDTRILNIFKTKGFRVQKLYGKQYHIAPPGMIGKFCPDLKTAWKYYFVEGHQY